jgi:hypothetical protein
VVYSGSCGGYVFCEPTSPYKFKKKFLEKNYVFFIRAEQHNTCAHMKTMQGGAANNERRPFFVLNLDGTMYWLGSWNRCEGSLGAF